MSVNRSKSDAFMLRFPDGMRDRIKRAAELNSRSMNAEIIATLEEKYPDPSIDINVLALFLQSLAGAGDPKGQRDYLVTINDMLSKTDLPFTVRAGGDGVVSFYPYATPYERSFEEEQEDE